MTDAQIVSILRNVYGFKEADYPTATLTPLIAEAIKKISIYYPEIILTYTTTIKDQSRYTVTHTGLIKINTIYYGHSESIEELFNDPDIPEVSLSEFSTFSPSLEYTRVQYQKMLEIMNPIAPDLIEVNKFDLIPTPHNTGDKVYYEYEKYRTITNTPDLFEDDVVQMVVWYLGQRIYLKEVAVQGGSSYNFDRRGNVQKQAAISTLMYKQRMDEHNNIIKSIQKKLMGIKL